MSTDRPFKMFSQTERQVFINMKSCIEARLKEMDMNKTKLAFELGISSSRLSMLLNDQSRGEVWSILDINKLADVLNVNITFLKGSIVFTPIVKKAKK